VKIIDAATGECSATFEGHSHDVNALAVVGSTLFSGADAKGTQREFLKSWNIATGELIRNLSGHTGGVWALATAPGMLFSASEDRTIRVWDIETGECLRILQGHEGLVRCLCYDEEEGRLYSGGHDNKVLSWDPNTGEQVGSFMGPGKSWITALLVDRGMLYASSTDKTVYVYDKASAERKSILNHENWVSSLAAHDGMLFTGVGDSTVCAWDPLKAELKFKLKGHLEFNAVSALLVHGGSLLSAGWDGAVTKWNLTMLQEKFESSLSPPEDVPVSKEQTKESCCDNSTSGSIFDEVDVELLD